jgi:HMG (high mobility group) box
MVNDDNDVGNLNLGWEGSPNASTNAATTKTEEIESNNDAETSPRQYRKGWRKPRGMPKRPMSSYNLFFQLERERLVNDEEERVFTPEDIDRIAKIQKQKDLSCQKRKHRKSHGKISFSKLARVIAEKWKSLDKVSKAAFFERAALEKDEYKVAVEEWARSNKTTSQARASSPTSEFLAQPIESPPSYSDEYAVRYESATSSPDIAFPTQLETTHNEMWDTANDTAVK